MLTTQKKVRKEYFEEVIIDVTVDDLVVETADVNDLIITLMSTDNLEEEISRHLIGHNRYDVKLDINGEQLSIHYYKGDLAFLVDINYVEMVG